MPEGQQLRLWHEDQDENHRARAKASKPLVWSSFEKEDDPDVFDYALWQSKWIYIKNDEAYLLHDKSNNQLLWLSIGAIWAEDDPDAIDKTIYVLRHGDTLSQLRALMLLEDYIDFSEHQEVLSIIQDVAQTEDGVIGEYAKRVLVRAFTSDEEKASQQKWLSSIGKKQSFSVSSYSVKEKDEVDQYLDLFFSKPYTQKNPRSKLFAKKSHKMSAATTTATEDRQEVRKKPLFGSKKKAVGSSTGKSKSKKSTLFKKKSIFSKKK